MPQRVGRDAGKELPPEAALRGAWLQYSGKLGTVYFMIPNPLLGVYCRETGRFVGNPHEDVCGSGETQLSASSEWRSGRGDGERWSPVQHLEGVESLHRAAWVIKHRGR